jgi:hypothetical protein
MCEEIVDRLNTQLEKTLGTYRSDALEILAEIRQRTMSFAPISHGLLLAFASDIQYIT